jgi:hypothetical protein
VVSSTVVPALRRSGHGGAELAGADRVDPDGRLVQEQHLGLVQQAAGDVQPLPHPPRVALDALLLPAGQPRELQQLADARLLLAGRHAVQLGEVAQVVQPGEPFVEPAVAAEHVADLAPHRSGVLDDVVPEHPGRAGGRQQQRDEHLDRRGLARTVGPEQPEQLAALDGEVDPPHRLDLA